MTLHQTPSDSVLGAKPPKTSRNAGASIRYWTAEEVRRFLTDNRDHHQWSLWYLAANSGMRRGATHGTPQHPDLVTQAFDRRVARTNVTRIRLHDLRHTHATLMLMAGIPPKIVSERLGHASVAFTMDVYAHVIPGMQGRRHLR